MGQDWGEGKGAQANESLPEEDKSGKIGQEKREAVNSGGGEGNSHLHILLTPGESSHLILGAFEGDPCNLHITAEKEHERKF